MEINQFRKYRLGTQIGLILIFLLINLMENLPYSNFFESFIYSLNYLLMVLGVVYCHYFLLFPHYLKGRRFSYFLATFGLMSIFIFIYHFIDHSLPFEYEEEIWSMEHLFESLIYDYLLLILLIFSTSMYYFAEKWVKNQATESELRNEKLQAELNFLKSQINPHFLFNTLNNIYAYAQTGNQKTAPMLERLSSILRFMVYECSENRVGLSKEIIAIEDLLEIHKMKNSEQRNIKLRVEGVKGFHLVAPLILVNFVENACKHSDVISNKEGFLKVDIKVNEKDECTFSIANSFRPKAVENVLYGGVGLSNIKKRLELQYGENFQLKEEKKETIYSMKLTIPLERKS